MLCAGGYEQMTTWENKWPRLAGIEPMTHSGYFTVLFQP
jgi:hypothetical protein